MRLTKKSINETSFHGTTISGTVAQLSRVLGHPTFATNDGEDKSNFEWERETETGLVFTVYDWKIYRPLTDDDDITWNIGGHSKEATEQAKAEIEEAMAECDICSYFIFGDAAKDYFADQEDLDKVADKLKAGDGDLHKYNPDFNSPTDLLSAFVGWGDFATISIDEYVTIKQLL